MKPNRTTPLAWWRTQEAVVAPNAAWSMSIQVNTKYSVIGYVHTWGLQSTVSVYDIWPGTNVITPFFQKLTQEFERYSRDLGTWNTCVWTPHYFVPAAKPQCAGTKCDYRVRFCFLLNFARATLYYLHETKEFNSSDKSSLLHSCTWRQFFSQHLC